MKQQHPGESLSTWIAEHIALPCVAAFAAGVLVALHFVAQPDNSITAQACEPAEVVAHHEHLAQGRQQ